MAIHPDEYSVDVLSEYLGQSFERIAYSCQYVHHANGEGNYFLPEVGSWCWVCIPSDHNKAFVMGFMPPYSMVDDHRANRLDLQPGDQAMVSRELNGIIIRRGGITQVGSTPVCQRIYTPIANTIRDLCENYELHSASGRLRWFARRNTPDENSRSPSELVLEAKEFAQDDPKVILRLGSVETPASEPSKGPRIPAGVKVVLDIEVVGSFKYRVNLNGDTLMVQEGDRSIHVKGEEIHFVDDDRELKILGNERRTLMGDSTQLFGGDVDVTVRGESTEKARKKVIVAPQVFLGNEAGAVATVLGPQLLNWLRTHTHISAAPGSQVTPPVQYGVLQDALFLTKNVKVT